MSDQQKKVIAIDSSGSTQGMCEYWQKVQYIINQHPNAKFVFWGSDYKTFDDQQSALRYMNFHQGNLGLTHPQLFIPFMAQNNCELIIITDGQIYESDIQACDQLLQGYNLSSVEIHFNGSERNMNLSVSAPFARNTRFSMFVNGEDFASGSTEEIDFDQYNNNPEKFLVDAENILKSLTLQNLGRKNANFKQREQLIKLKNNLIKYLANQAAANQNSNNEFNVIRQNLLNNDLLRAKELMRSFILNQDSSISKNIENIFQEMLNCIDNRNNFSFDMLRPGRLNRANEINKPAEDELPAVEEYQGNFECPIMYENALPVLMIFTGSPVLAGVDKGYVDNIITNPFLLLNNQELVNKIKARIGHPIGLDQAREHFNNMTCPFTHNQVSTFISFENERSHIKYTKYALANLLFGNKLVGIPELWLAVIYLICNNITYLNEEEKPGFMSSFKNYLINRCQNQTTRLTLTGLAVEPVVTAPVDIAIWYCVMSPLLISNPNGINIPFGEDDARNRLRSFGTGAIHLVEILKLFNYIYESKWVDKTLKIYAAFSWMMNQEKDNTQWRRLIRAQYQNSLTVIVDDQEHVILLDGPATNMNHVPENSAPKLPNQLNNLNDLGLLCHLATLVDRSKKTNLILMPQNVFDTFAVPKPVTNYGYSANMTANDMMTPISICPNTLRPYTYDRKTNNIWLVESEKKWGPIDKQLHINKYFIDYITVYERYPTIDELIYYMYKRQMNKEFMPMDTLCKFVREGTQQIFNDYEEVLGKNFEKILVERFVDITVRSRNREDRKYME